MKLIRNEKDIENDENAFHPAYTHQLFGDSENIFGYRNLRVNLYYTARALKLYLAIDFAEQIDSKDADGVQPDDVLAIIKEKLDLQPPLYTTNLDQFSKWLVKDEFFHPHGDKVHAFEEQERSYEVYNVNAKMSAEFIQEHHEQMQHFLLWFIDGASYIDIEDDKWDYFTLYERQGERDYYFAGYATVYRYYAYPANTRPRISQVLILPPFQRRNLGVQLLSAMYAHYRAQSGVIDITVEDPSDSFSQLRNFVDCLACSKLPAFSRKSLHEGWNKKMAEEAKEKLRINGRQARKVYEILKLKCVDTNNEEEYRNYRLEVKRRLSAPLMKNRKSTKFFGSKQNADQTPREVIIEELTAVYGELEKEYKSTIERMNSVE